MAAAALRRLVLGVLAPAHHRRLVAPERQRQHLALVGQAGEALDGNEAVDLLELGPERRRDVEIVALAPRLGAHLEDHHVHVRASFQRLPSRSEEHTTELQSLIPTSYAVLSLT